MSFVDRNEQGVICGEYARRQRDGQEELSVEHPDLIAFRNLRSAERNLGVARAARVSGLPEEVDTIHADRVDLRAKYVEVRDRFLALEAWAKTKGYSA